MDFQQAMWFPTLNIEGRDDNEVWARFAGVWDEWFFYVAAEVYDPTPGVVRRFDNPVMSLMHAEPYDDLYWQFAIPGWSRRGSDGKQFDGLKIAFDVLPVGEKEDPLFPKEAQLGVNQRFERIGPDYEYDLSEGRTFELAELYESVLTRHRQRLADPPDKDYASRKPPFEGPTLRAVGDPVQ